MMNNIDATDKNFRIVSRIVFITAITELALSQLAIRIMRMSSEELTGIAYFAFIIAGLVSLFVTSRMKESFFGKVFAIIINLVTALAGLWSLQLLISDEIFFRNLYYNLNRQTQEFELLPAGGLIMSSIPIALIILGSVVYCVCSIFILISSLASLRKKTN